MFMNRCIDIATRPKHNSHTDALLSYNVNYYIYNIIKRFAPAEKLPVLKNVKAFRVFYLVHM